MGKDGEEDFHCSLSHSFFQSGLLSLFTSPQYWKRIFEAEKQNCEARQWFPPFTESITKKPCTSLQEMPWFAPTQPRALWLHSSPAPTTSLFFLEQTQHIFALEPWHCLYSCLTCYSSRHLPGQLPLLNLWANVTFCQDLLWPPNLGMATHIHSLVTPYLLYFFSFSIALISPNMLRNI